MKNNCENCANYVYDDQTDEYYCEVNLDEDEYLKFLTNKNANCPYYKYYDEYKSVQKQNW